MSSRRTVILAVAFGAGALLTMACDDDDDMREGGRTQTPITVQTPEATEADGESEPAADIVIVAEETSFDTEVIRVAAGESLGLELQNEDPFPHSFAVMGSDGEPIFQIPKTTGPGATETGTFDVPAEAGEYEFHCQVHPDQMKGTLVVE